MKEKRKIKRQKDKKRRDINGADVDVLELDNGSTNGNDLHGNSDRKYPGRGEFLKELNSLSKKNCQESQKFSEKFCVTDGKGILAQE
jgi:hypothetical protein